MDNSFTFTMTVAQTPTEVFNAIIDVRSWWIGDIDGPTDRLDAEFTYRHQENHRSIQRITELDPGVRVVWRVVEAYLAFTGDPHEWTGTDIVFDISAERDGTRLTFTHVGLTPDIECFDRCTPAWTFYVGNSLRDLIATGHGGPAGSEPCATS